MSAGTGDLGPRRRPGPRDQAVRVLQRVTSTAYGRHQTAAVRIGFAGTWLLFLLRELPHRREMYGPDGPWSWDMAHQLIARSGAFTVLMWSDGAAWFEFVYAAALLSAALLLLGWRTRTMSLLFMAGVLSLQNRSVFLGDGGDNVIHLMAIYLVLTRCGEVWSLDARRAARAAAASGGDARPPAAPAPDDGTPAGTPGPGTDGARTDGPAANEALVDGPTVDGARVDGARVDGAPADTLPADGLPAGTAGTVGGRLADGAALDTRAGPGPECRPEYGPTTVHDRVGPLLWAVLGVLLLIGSVTGRVHTEAWMLTLFWGTWVGQALWWAANRSAPDGEPRALLDVLAHLLHNAGLAVIMAEVCLVYATAGWYKIQGSRWQDGTALYYPLELDYFSPWPALSGLFAASGVIVLLLTYSTVIAQVAFPFTLFNRRVKNLLLVVMMLEHAGIAVLLGLPFFSLAMIAADAVFLPTNFLSRLGSWVVGGRNRLVRRAGPLPGRRTGSPEQPRTLVG